MKLIADSGSTKTDWYLVDSNQVCVIQTQGYNPYYFTTAEMQQSLEEELLHVLEASQIENLYFYGSGCSNDITQGIVRAALEPAFQQAQIHLGDDLLAAARATAGHEAGICCILGTGTNSCYYNGTTIADKIPSLGYILGDEGAGVYLGKMLVQAYFYREMPEDLSALMGKAFKMDKHVIISTLLDGKNPNRYLAGFALFAVEHREHPFVQQVIAQSFDDFLKRHVLKYPEAQELPVHFVGSVASGFQTELKKRLEHYDLQIGKVLKSPFPDLLDY